MKSPDRIPSVGERIPALLKDYGIEVVFGIPGVHNVELYRGLLNSGVRHVLTRHEQGAGFMADGYARVTGKPAACFVITGPGLTNLMTPLGQAYSDSMPLLAIASTLDRPDIGQGQGRLHEMTDQRAAAATVCGSALTIGAPAMVPDALAKAFADFATCRPRPAYIELPIDVMTSPLADVRAAERPPSPSAPSPDAVARAAQTLAGAKRPVMIVGGGAVAAFERVRALNARLGAIVLTTIAGKGVVADSDPLCVGANLGSAPAQACLADADVVLAIGTELAETDHWAERLDIRDTLVRIDIDPRVLSDRHGADIALLGDAGLAIDALLAALPAGDRAPRTADAAALRQALDDAVDDRTRRHAGVLRALREALPADTAVITDMTQIAYAGNELFPVEQPRSWVHPVGFGTLGYALPAAIGARIGAPDRPVVALAGDYGFQYTLPELAVAAEHELPIVLVLWNNDMLGAIRHSMEKNDIEPVAVDQKNPDFMTIASAYGCPAWQPDSLAAIGPAIAAALEHRGPSFVEIRQSVMFG